MATLATKFEVRQRPAFGVTFMTPFLVAHDFYQEVTTLLELPFPCLQKDAFFRRVSFNPRCTVFGWIFGHEARRRELCKALPSPQYHQVLSGRAARDVSSTIGQQADECGQQGAYAVC